MKNASHTIRKELRGIVVFLALIWLCFVASKFLPLTDYGLQPRRLQGVVGIAAMPFLHANFSHITSNTVPLVVLLCLLAGSQARSWWVVVEIVLFSGALLWLVGRSAIHIGTSGLVFGLITYLILSGVFERRIVSLIISAVTFILYGSTLVWGVIPVAPGVSWEGHLCGVIAGGLLAFAQKPRARGSQRLTTR